MSQEETNFDAPDKVREIVADVRATIQTHELGDMQDVIDTAAPHIAEIMMRLGWADGRAHEITPYTFPDKGGNKVACSFCSSDTKKVKHVDGDFVLKCNAEQPKDGQATDHTRCFVQGSKHWDVLRHVVSSPSLFQSGDPDFAAAYDNCEQNYKAACALERKIRPIRNILGHGWLYQFIDSRLTVDISGAEWDDNVASGLLMRKGKSQQEVVLSPEYLQPFVEASRQLTDLLAPKNGPLVTIKPVRKAP